MFHVPRASLVLRSKPSPFNSKEWLACNFSLQYPYIIQQTGNENTQTYQEDVIIMNYKHQILIIILQGNVYQLEGRILKQSNLGN